MESISVLQLSDLHIGRKLFGNTFWKWPLSGFNPHDDRVLDDLYLRLDEIRYSSGFGMNDPLHVVITGDLTAGGTLNDFALAYTLLRNRYEHTPGILDEEVGLGLPRSRTLLIPGNHDHWNGDKTPRPYNASLAGVYFQRTPWRRTLRSKGKSLRLELFGVDSNSGMPLQSPYNKFSAMGSISDLELKGLLAQLHHSMHVKGPVDAKQGIKRVRTLLCHHAFAAGTSYWPFPLEAKSRRVLERLAATYKVPVVLTGHMHERVNYNQWPRPNGPLRRIVGRFSDSGSRSDWVVRVSTASD